MTNQYACLYCEKPFTAETKDRRNNKAIFCSIGCECKQINKTKNQLLKLSLLKTLKSVGA